MYEQLAKFKDEKTMVAIYTNENDGDAFSVGYICDLEQDRALLLNVGIHGEYDGYTALYIDDIFRVECNGKYLDKMKKLISFDIDEKIIVFNQENTLDFLIAKAKNDNKILAIQYNYDSEIKGYVKKSDTVIHVIEIDEYGYEDGRNIISMNSINKIVFDDVDCRDLEKLFKINKTVIVNFQVDGGDVH